LFLPLGSEGPVWNITSPSAHSRTDSRVFLCLGVHALTRI
jgi:hypothetical protein